MVDTGSNLNLTKENAVDSRAWINRETIYHITGIGSGMYTTLGKIKVKVKGVETHFNIIPENFPIKQQGILGMQFLRENKAVLNFGDEELMFRDQSIPFQEYHTVHLPARTKKLIDIPVMNPLAKDGYIGRIQAGPGVFLGESLVSQNGGYIKTFAINSNTHDINLTLAPVELEPYYAVPPRARAAAIPNSPVEATKVEAKRLARLLEVLDLSGLNEEEKQSLLPILADYSP